MNKIYIHTENEEYGDFTQLKSGLVSWSTELNNDSDLKFISVDFLLHRLEEGMTELDCVEGNGMSANQKRNRLRGIKKELVNLIML